MSEPAQRPLPPSVRVALATYPPSFRERYGTELGALLEDMDRGRRVVPDLLAGSFRAWLRPALGPDAAESLRRRRLATVSTVWVCWCAVFVAVPALLRALEDPPPEGFDPTSGGWGVVHAVMTTALAAGWGLVMLVGAPIGLRALRSSPAVRRTVVPPLLLLGVCALGFVPLQVYASRHWVGPGRTATASDIPLWWAMLLLVWLAATLSDAVWGTLALAGGLRRAELDVVRLRWPTIAAGLLVVPMAVTVVLVVAVALGGARPSAAGALAPLVYAAVATLLAVLVVASTSAVRGLRAGAR